MKDITYLISHWVKCCNDVWQKWFTDIENQEDEFIEVEETLFSSLVLSQLNCANRLTSDQFYNLLIVEYKTEINDKRSICKIQQTGTIFCQAELVNFECGAEFPIKSIDALGTMMNNHPYAEIKLDDNRFLLEPIKNLTFKIMDENHT